MKIFFKQNFINRTLNVKDYNKKRNISNSILQDNFPQQEKLLNHRYVFGYKLFLVMSNFKSMFRSPPRMIGTHYSNRF